MIGFAITGNGLTNVAVPEMLHPAASTIVNEYTPAHRLSNVNDGGCPFQEMVWTPVPPFDCTLIAPSQLPIQFGLNVVTVGGGKFGGPGATNTVSGPKLFAFKLQFVHPALQIG